MTMKGYKITARHRGHLCHECGHFINLGAPAIIDTGLSDTRVREKSYFHPQCYRDTQLTLNPTELKEFDDKLHTFWLNGYK